jgi:hypothetical protein
MMLNASLNYADVNSTLNNAAGKAQQSQGMTVESFLASLSVSSVTAVIGILTFILLKDQDQHRLARI